MSNPSNWSLFPNVRYTFWRNYQVDGVLPLPIWPLSYLSRLSDSSNRQPLPLIRSGHIQRLNC